MHYLLLRSYFIHTYTHVCTVSMFTCMNSSEVIYNRRVYVCVYNNFVYSIFTNDGVNRIQRLRNIWQRG